MIVLAFFFLLRPGEYTATKSDTTPFRLCDVRLSVGSQYLDIFTATPEQLHTANFASLTFTDQKPALHVATGAALTPTAIVTL